MGMADQAGALRRQVNAMKARIEGAKVVDPANFQRVETAKDRLLNVCRQRLVELDDFNGQAGNNWTSADRWRLLMGIGRRSRALAADCLAFEQSVSLRAKAPAAGVCAAADRIAEEFSSKVGQPRLHYAVVSEAEHFGADASAIHLSYARLDLWSLNRAVHEFGHLWAEEFASGPGGAQTAFIASIAGKWAPDPAKEFFADLIATFLLGPAYAYSCLLLDFNPADRIGSDTHPSGDERAHAILTALEQLAAMAEFTAPQMTQLLQELRLFWSSARTAADASGPIRCAQDLEYAVKIGIKRLKKEIPNAGQFSLSLANGVALSLAEQQGNRPAQARASDILNGAWLRRRADPANASTIAKKALAMITGNC